MKKIILFEGDIETQGYFSIQMKKELERLGHPVYLYDLKSPWKSSMEMLAFIEKGNTAVLSFNFHGMCMEPQFVDEEGTYIWDALGIPCYNILADHPYYYYQRLAEAPKNYIQLSIDLGHEVFMKRFFPEVKLGPFLPLAGTELAEILRTSEKDGIPCELLPERVDSRRPMTEREIDVIFTGNYADPARFEKYITRLGDEYTQFYYEMIHDLLEHPQQRVEDVVERYLRREIPDVTEAQLKETMQNITFIDLYIRYYARGQVVRALVDAGVKVHVFGDKWDELVCKHPENLINGDSLYSEECLYQIQNSKISLNVLPWFRRGPHDRIFNTMLNGAVCLTDSNPYLDEMLVGEGDGAFLPAEKRDEASLPAELTDAVNCIKYSLTNPEQMAEHVIRLLADTEKLQKIADAGYKLAQEHTWAARMREFSKWLAKD
ncbi:MAG: glycosyltransferase family 1 protein [Eubacterium sp.]|nr:glycosyltransferase family 1 protein [Eubacterium sp.]